MRLKIWVESNLHPEAMEQLSHIADTRTGDDPALAEGADAAVISTLVTADAAFFDTHGSTLRLVARPGIGVDNVDLEAASSRGIAVINSPDAPTESTAEHAVALLLAAAKRIVAGHRSFSDGGLPRAALYGTELRGLTLGVVGFGRIGRRVAEICGAGLGMRVAVYDPYVRRGDPGTTAKWLSFSGSLDALLSTCDVLTLHASLTPATRHMIGTRELGLMKRGTYLINVARGPLIEESALVAALKEDRLSGAGLDVFEIEPPSPDNPLLSLPNVAVTPHVASFTDAARRRMGLEIARQIGQISNGERPGNLVNPQAWPGRFGKGDPL